MMKGVNLACRVNLLDANRAAGVTLEDIETYSQGALIKTLVLKSDLSKGQRFKQIANMNSSKKWKALCQKVGRECTIPSIRLAELLEAVLIYEIRQNDGHDGFYVASKHGFTKSPDHMYEHQDEMDEIVKGFTPKRNSIHTIMSKLEHGIPQRMVQTIANALEFGAYHMILPNDTEKILNSLDGKKGKYYLKFKDLLSTLRNDTLKFAKVKEYLTDGPHGNFNYYVSDLLIDDLSEEDNDPMTRNENEETCPSTPNQTEPSSCGQRLPSVTPDRDYNKRKIESDFDDSIGSPKKGMFYVYNHFIGNFEHFETSFKFRTLLDIFLVVI